MYTFQILGKKCHLGGGRDREDLSQPKPMGYEDAFLGAEEKEREGRREGLSFER